jgi:hypothetical protein
MTAIFFLSFGFLREGVTRKDGLVPTLPKTFLRAVLLDELLPLIRLRFLSRHVLPPRMYWHLVATGHTRLRQMTGPTFEMPF